MRDPGQPPETVTQITPVRRVAAAIAGLFLPPGAGLIVLGRPGFAAMWLVAAMAAYAAILVSPVGGLLAGVLCTVGAILHSLFVAPPEGGLPPIGRFLLMLAGFVVFGTVARTQERAHLADAFRAPTAAMEPVLLEGELFMADRRNAAPAIGQLWAFDPEQVPAKPRDFAQRVVALPGQTVSLRGGVLQIDGRSVVTAEARCLSEVAGGTCVARSELHGGTQVLAEYRQGVGCSPAFPAGACPNGLEMRDEACVVPPGHVFMLGDNRCEADDSRRYGAIPLNALGARALAVHWSSNEAGPRWHRIGARLGP